MYLNIFLIFHVLYPELIFFYVKHIFSLKLAVMLITAMTSIDVSVLQYI